jgi:hypothetical protein
MKRTPSGLFKSYCATAFTPLAILSIVPCTQAKPADETHSVPALGQVAALRPQETTGTRPQIAKVARNFSFSPIQASFLSTKETANSQALSLVPKKISSDEEVSNKSLSFQSSLPVGRSSPTLLAQNASDAAPLSSAPDSSDYLQNQKPNRFFIGPEIFYRNYSEGGFGDPNLKSFEHGFLYGVKVQYDFVKRNSVYIGADFRYDRGQTTYDGSTQDGIPINNATTDNEFINFEGRLGYTFKADKVGRFLLTPYVGYGYQQWNRNLNGDGEIPGVGPIQTTAFSEDYSWNYLAGGLRAEYRPSRRFTVGMNFKLMGMINGNLDLKIAGANATLDLGEHIQAEVEFPITYHIVDKPKSGIDIRFTPFYRSQNIGPGNPLILDANGNGIREPQSTTDVYGATFGVVFSF